MSQINEAQPIDNYDELLQNLTEWSNPPTVGDLKNDISQATSTHAEHLNDLERWDAILKGNLTKKTVEGRSQVQPKVGRKQAEWRYPSLENPFFSSPDLFNVEPATHLDVLSAKQNAIILNKQFRVDICRVKFINSYVRTAVNTGTVIVKVGWDERVGMTYEEFEVPIYAETQEERLAFLEQQVADRVLEPDMAAELARNGAPLVVDIKKETREVERVVFNGPVLEVKDSRNIIIDPTCMGDITKANFIVDTFISDLSTLRKDGRYSNLEYIDTTNHTLTSATDIPHKYDEKNTSFEYTDEPRKKLLVHEYWGFWDIEGTGIVEPILATFVGDIMIRLEKNPFPDKKLPFVLVQYIPSVDPDNVYGEPDVALIEDNQQIIGAITRGVLDVFARHANAQQGVAKGFLDEVNMKRFREGQDYMFNPQLGGLQNAYVQAQYPDFPRGAFDLLQYQTNEAQELTGIIPFSGGQAAPTERSVKGMNITLDATAKREVSILQRLSQGLVDIGKKIIAMNSIWLTDEEIIRITDEEFVTISRTSLSGQFDLTISISTAEEDEAKAQELAFLLQTMGNTTDFGIVKIIMAKIADLRRMPDVVKAIEKYEPQPDPVAQQLHEMQLVIAQLEAQKLETEIAENMAQVDRYRAQTARELAQADLLKSNKDKTDLDFMEQATGLAHDRDVEKLEKNRKDDAKSDSSSKVKPKGRTNGKPTN